jgi:hypothetical protein
MANNNRILVKLLPSNGLRAAESRVNLRPLVGGARSGTPMALAGTPDWYVAELEDGASPWDLAHNKVAAQLGVAESDVLFAEPDLKQTIFRDGNELPRDGALAIGEQCEATAQDGTHGKALGPARFGWHLEDAFSGLKTARETVQFTAPRTRIAHVDTGYFPKHIATPAIIARELERNFVPDDENPGSAEDPDNRVLILDNSGHGTGTIGILAGKQIESENMILGGAPDAEIVPLRIADSVVLFRTSAFAEAIRYATAQHCDVVSLSMGGLPSKAWSDAVNDAYLNGLCVVAAAGNNVNGAPTRHVVYPARYHRVIAVVGVMANGEPYAGLDGLTLEGNFGPDSSMKVAIAAFTPNIPWALFGCPEILRLNGEGTSAATPQIAAAVALWFEHHKSVLPRDWRRIEAVRNALFTSAKKVGNAARLGNGILQAHRALDVKPVLTLPQSKADDDSFAFFRVITGLGITEPPPREQMFNVELSQLWLLNPELQKIVPDPEKVDRLETKPLKEFMERVIEDPRASFALRRHIAQRYPALVGASVPHNDKTKEVVPDAARACDKEVALMPPPYRKLRVYAMDPSFSTRLETASINEATLEIPWENDLQPGPAGEYLEVVDTDASGKTYEKVNLNDPSLLAQNGWQPSEGNPAFHQQMVYGVAMKTISYFERAMGRPVLWRHGKNPKKPKDDKEYRGQLRVEPHALRQANAFYSPDHIRLQFGYFEAAPDDPGDHVPGSRIYACLSHDIVAHETTHAILDGIYAHFNEPTNPDVLALHEAFADVVALMQHFTMTAVLDQEIGRTRGDLESESTLGALALQFGRAMGGRGALRDAIGKLDENGKWVRQKPSPDDYKKILTPHARGAILVATIFDAFLAIYKARIADLLRISTEGRGVLPPGAIHPDLVRRLAEEASKSAEHVLMICIRALDYLPPVDVTFGDYLRGLITADFDVVSDDRYNYRVAFVEAFRRRGIYPFNFAGPGTDGLRTLSADTLRWQGFDLATLTKKERTAVESLYARVIDQLKEYADRCLYLKNRKELFEETRQQRLKLHTLFESFFESTPEFAAGLGLDPTLGSFEVHALRRSVRVGSNGRQIPQVIVSLMQSTTIPKTDKTPAHPFYGGTTIVLDLSPPSIRYLIGKNINNRDRRERTATFRRENANDALRDLIFGMRPEPFAALHTLGDLK